MTQFNDFKGIKRKRESLNIMFKYYTLPEIFFQISM